MLIYGFSGESSQSKQNTGYIQIYTLPKISLFGLVDNFAINFFIILIYCLLNVTKKSIFVHVLL